MFKDAQMCTMGFPTTVSDCSGSNCVTRQGTFIVPDMRFTCSGTVTGWRASGERIFNGNKNSALIIWRKTGSESETYDNVDRIELGACAGQRVETGMNNVYECILDQGDRVSVQPGDIIGIETPRPVNGNFRLYFVDSSDGPTNYIFNSGAPQTINLDDSNLLIDQLVPQISLTVTASVTQIPTTEMTDGSTTTSGPTSTEAESITTSDRTTEMTDGSTTTSGPSSTEAESITTSDPTTEMTDGSTTTSEPTSTEAEAIVTSDRIIEMTDGGTITSGPTLTEARSKDFTTTSSSRLDNSANNPQDKDNSDTSIAIVGAVVGILLVFISVLLLIIILRRQRSGQKSSPASNNNNNIITNPVYNGPGMQSSIIILL